MVGGEGGSALGEEEELSLQLRNSIVLELTMILAIWHSVDLNLTTPSVFCRYQLARGSGTLTSI